MSRSISRRVAVLVGLVLLIGWVAADWYVALPVGAKAEYVGRAACAECHRAEVRQWADSQHDRAMELATELSVLGDFDDAEFTRFGVKTRLFRRGDQYWVNTEGPDGKHRDYQVKYTFGVTPLQQYMVELSDGRVQVLRVSWDTLQKKWFHVPPPDATDERIEPGDPLHWTGLAQNWNTMCAECHSTNLQKNYDLRKNAYHTTYSEIDVSCEACHGPGSLHVALAGRRSLFWDRRRGYALAKLGGDGNEREIESCAPCHSRRSPIYADFRAGMGEAGSRFADYFAPALLTPGLYHADGQILDEVYVYGSFLQSKMHGEGVRCTDCHNPHSLQLKFEGNRLCTQCHESGKYDSPTHHHHKPDTPAAACVSCHMPERTYMVVDPRRDHSLRIPRPDLTVQIGTPNACNDCHAKPEESAGWAADAVREWYGDRRPDEKKSSGPHYGVALDAARQGSPEGQSLLRKLLHRKETPDIVRATAVELLANYDSRETETLCREALKHDNPLVRAAAVRAISDEGLRRFTGEVASRLDDPVRLVRMAAAHRLVQHGEQLIGSEYRDSLQLAIREFRKGQQVTLDRAGSHLNLAGISIMQGKLAEACDSLRNAIRVEPYLTGPRGELARLLDQLGTGDQEKRQAEIRRLREQEVELLARDFKLLPNDPAPRYQQGMLLYLLGEPDRALVALREACRLDPNSYQNHLAVALLCEKQQLWDEALGALGQIQKLRPGDPAIRGILVRMQQARRKAETTE